MKNILIIDDAITIRTFLTKTLSEVGMNVTEACNGSEGLEKLYDKNYDLVITDVNMPVLNGIEMITKIRSNSEILQPPILVLSTENDYHDFHQARLAGANFFVVKPPNPAEFVKIVSFMSGYENV